MQHDNKPQQHIPQPTPDISVGISGERNPDDWITGTEPISDTAKIYLKILSEEAGEGFDENLSKAEASKRIEELQFKTGRGLNKLV
jgi:hypothetical protein